MSTTALTEPLTQAQRKEYQTLKPAIKNGAETFLEVGQALVRIHEGRLYREEFPTFEAFCEAQGIVRQTAYNLMGAVQLTLQLTDVNRVGHDEASVNTEVLKRTSEKALRKLKNVTPANRGKVLRAVAARTNGKPVTAKAIEIEAARVEHKPLPARKPLPIPPNRAPQSDMGIPLSQPEPPDTLADTASTTPLDPKHFQAALEQLVARIPSAGDHAAYAAILNKAATAQANWGRQTMAGAAWAYTR